MGKLWRLFAAAGVSALMLAGPALAAQTCHDIHLEATDSAAEQGNIFGKFAGTAYVSIDGQPPVPAAVSFVPAEIKFGEDGTVHMINSLAFDFGPMGALTVQDNAILSPTPDPYLYNMNSRLDNLTGTGSFAGAIGRFTDHGQFSLATLTLTATADGRICW